MILTPAAYVPPRLTLLHTEGVRAAADTTAYLCALPGLVAGDRGDGHDVLVVPGFLAEDVSTLALRAVLRARGYRSHAWHLGLNLGPTRATVDGLVGQIDRLADAGRGPVSLVGWSLGGVLAREIARMRPEQVRCVVTLGSPFRLTARHSPSSTHAGWIYHALRRWHTDLLDHDVPEEERPPLSMPSTSIYSRRDGIVPWQSCMDIPGDLRENVEVTASHFGLGASPEVIGVVIDRLSQPVGEWQPYAGSRHAASSS
ncbi:alpha/beta hydrolase [Nocardioides maradonensis]